MSARSPVTTAVVTVEWAGAATSSGRGVERTSVQRGLPARDASPGGTRGHDLRRTGSDNGFLFSVPGQVEGFGQMQGGLVERQTMDRRPEIQHVAFASALGVEAAEGALAQVMR